MFRPISKLYLFFFNFLARGQEAGHVHSTPSVGELSSSTDVTIKIHVVKFSQYGMFFLPSE